MLKLDILVFFHIHHPCGFRENLGVIKMILVAFQFPLHSSILCEDESIEIELAC